MLFNFYALLGAAFVPALLGLVWFNGAVFGKAAGLNEQQLASANRPLVLIMSVVLGFLVAFALVSLTIHQQGFFSIMVGEPEFGKDGSASTLAYQQFVVAYGDKFRSFGHGALHGVMSAITIAFPFFGLQTMREGRGWKYFGAHAGFWLVCFAIMGALVCGVR